MASETYETGLKIRKEVLGEEYVSNALDNADSFNREFQNLVTEYCWGASWGGEALTRKQRSLNNLCMLSVLNRGHEFKIHFRGALKNGCTMDEIRETLMQVAIYAGVPAGVEAFRLAREIINEDGISVS